MADGDAMKARLCVTEPEAMSYTMTLTASVDEWGRLRDQLDQLPVHAYQAGELRRLITDLIAQARKIYWASEEKP